jgi:hypothetical protein
VLRRGHESHGNERAQDERCEHDSCERGDCSSSSFEDTTRHGDCGSGLPRPPQENNRPSPANRFPGRTRHWPPFAAHGLYLGFD